MTALSTAAEAIAATKYEAAREHLQQSVELACGAANALPPWRPSSPYSALESLRAARRHIDRAEAAIRLGMAASARRDAEQQ